MPGIHRTRVLVAALGMAGALAASSGPALAQRAPDVSCRRTETQPECHARLRCRKDEELEECQKRLLRCRSGEDLEECRKRAREESAKEGGAGERDEGERERGERGDREGRDREERDREEGDGDEADRGRGEREGRGDGDGSRRRRSGRRGGEGGGAGGYAGEKTFGLGLELGEPTGLNGKLFLSESVALDFGVGWIYSHYYYDDGLHVYADILWHPVSLVSAQAFELPLYLGGGLRFWDFEYCDRGVCGYDGSVVGIRIPIGIAFDFNEVPLDIFLQLVPVIDFVDDDYRDRYGDRTHVGVDFSVGIRYWFL